MQQNIWGLDNSIYETCQKLWSARNNTDSEGQFHLDTNWLEGRRIPTALIPSINDRVF